MGKSVSRQREIERRFTEERDNLFKEFACAKSEIQRNFNKQRHELEGAFHEEIQKLYKLHEGQINTIKLQMRDSQLGDFHEQFGGRLSRHLSWPIAENPGTQSSKAAEDTRLKQCEKIREKEGVKTSEEWQILVEHLKFALNNQKALFENALLDEKLKMQKQLEIDRVEMEEKLFKRMNGTLLDAIKERKLIYNKENETLNQISRNILSDWVLIKEYSKQRDKRRSRVIESESDEENSEDSGVDERGRRKKDKRGNYWRMKYIECQKKYTKKMLDTKEHYEQREKSMKEDLRCMKTELNEKHLQEINDMQNLAAKELQKSLKEERNTSRGIIKELNEKLKQILKENEELKIKTDDLKLLLNSDVDELQKELIDKLEALKEILSIDD